MVEGKFVVVGAAADADVDDVVFDAPDGGDVGADGNAAGKRPGGRAIWWLVGKMRFFQRLENIFPMVGKIGANFPMIGKFFRRFSNDWKKFSAAPAGRQRDCKTTQDNFFVNDNGFHNRSLTA